MIRRGKAEGWLTIPSDAVLPWAMLNEVEFNKSVPGVVSGRGGALLAKEDVQVSEDQAELTVLLTVPKDQVLSLERCQEQAKFDRDYREVFESLGDFGRVGIGLRILIFQTLFVADSMSDTTRCHSFLPTCSSFYDMSSVVDPSQRSYRFLGVSGIKSTFIAFSTPSPQSCTRSGRIQNVIG
jgi:hypothetical protein